MNSPEKSEANPLLNPRDASDGALLCQKLEELRTLIFQLQIPMPSSPPRPQTHLKCTESEMTRMLERVKHEITILRMVQKDHVSVNDNRGLFWLACKHLNLRPRTDFLDTILEEDIIEIYSLSNKQMFCSCSFWSLVSYSIEEVFRREFWELYERPEFVNHSIQRSISKALTVNHTVPFNCPTHVMQEISSQERFKFEMNLRFVSPMHDRKSGEMVAFASSLQAVRL